MNCEAMNDMFELYSLGLLDGPEKAELEAHLGRNCPECTANLKHAMAVNAMLLGMSPEAEPPARLKRKVMASVGVEQSSGWGWLAAVAAACMLVVALWVGNQERQRTIALADARQALAQATRTASEVTGERDRLAQALIILDQPETIHVSFGKGVTAPPRGNIFIHSKLGVMLVASNLPKLDAGKIYEMWLVPKEGKGSPRPAGLFQSTGEQAMNVLQGPVDLRNLYAIAVTVEPEAGSQAPTTRPLLVATAGV
jgi:hypothetical protein